MTDPGWAIPGVPRDVPASAGEAPGGDSHQAARASRPAGPGSARPDGDVRAPAPPGRQRLSGSGLLSRRVRGSGQHPAACRSRRRRAW